MRWGLTLVVAVLCSGTRADARERHVPLVTPVVLSAPAATPRPGQAQAATGQTPVPGLTIDLALDAAVAADAEVRVRLLRAPTGSEETRPAEWAALRRRAADVMAEVRRAYTELEHARARAALYDQISPVLLDMADTGSGPAPLDDMRVHDPRTITGMAQVGLARVSGSERVRLAEHRLRAVMGDVDAESGGTRLDGTSRAAAATSSEASTRGGTSSGEASADGVARIAALIPRTFSTPPAQPERVASERAAAVTLMVHEPGDALAAAVVSRDAVERTRRVRDARTRVDAARERLRLTRTTLVSQAQQAYDSARLAYASQRATLGDVVDTARVMFEARLSEADARADLDRALVEMEVAIGEAPERIAAALAAARARTAGAGETAAAGTAR